MQNISSAFTLFLKFVLPAFWIVFFSSFTMAFIFSDAQIATVSKSSFSIGLIVFLVSGILTFVFTTMRLKRVEMDADFIYVTNYFKWYKYPYHNIERMIERDYIFLKLISIHLKVPGNFGKKIHFLADHRKFNEFLKANPEVMEQLYETE